MPSPPVTSTSPCTVSTVDRARPRPSTFTSVYTPERSSAIHAGTVMSMSTADAGPRRPSVRTLMVEPVLEIVDLRARHRVGLDADGVAGPGLHGDLAAEGVDLEPLAPLGGNGRVDLPRVPGQPRTVATMSSTLDSFQLTAETRLAAWRSSSSLRRLVSARWELR